MYRFLVLLIGALTISLASLRVSAGEVFPSDHHEPIMVRVLSGKSGLPVPYAHVLLIAGYDDRDMKLRLWKEEKLTDLVGKVILSYKMENFPWLQVWVQGSPLCQDKPRQEAFNVDVMRHDGLSTPNRCGVITVEDAPGVFTVFVKASGKKVKPKLKTVALAESLHTQVPAAALPPVTKPTPVMEQPVTTLLLPAARGDAPTVTSERALPLFAQEELPHIALKGVPLAKPAKRSLRHRVRVHKPASCPVTLPAEAAKTPAGKLAQPVKGAPTEKKNEAGAKITTIEAKNPPVAAKATEKAPVKSSEKTKEKVPAKTETGAKSVAHRKRVKAKPTEVAAVASAKPKEAMGAAETPPAKPEVKPEPKSTTKVEPTVEKKAVPAEVTPAKAGAEKQEPKAAIPSPVKPDAASAIQTPAPNPAPLTKPSAGKPMIRTIGHGPPKDRKRVVVAPKPGSKNKGEEAKPEAKPEEAKPAKSQPGEERKEK